MSFDLSLLGVKENIPRVNFAEYTGLIQAPPKWGKTTIASMYGKSILAAVEPGFKAKRLNYRDCTTWVKFVDFIDSLEKYRKQIGDEIQTIAIDTVDRLYPECQQYIVDEYNKNPKNKYKVDSIGNIPHGKGWGLADEEFLHQLNRILNMQFTILFLTHNKVKTINPENEDPYDVYVPTMPQRCADIIYPLVDFIINGERVSVEENGIKTTKRVMRIRSNGNSDSGNRIGEMDETIIFDTEEEGINKFREAFKKGIEYNIRLSGISTPIEDIERQQNEERKEQLDNYLKSVQESPKEDNKNELDIIMNEIKTKSAELAKTHRQELIEAISKHNNGNANYNTIKDLTVAQAVLDEINKIGGSN